MSATYPTNTKEKVANRAIGYNDNDKLVRADDWPALRPSGAFLSTVLDLAKWDAVLETDRVLSESTRLAMWTPVALNGGGSHPYGFGWQIDSLDGHRRVSHSGGMVGFRTELARFVDDRLTIVLLMNLDDVDLESITIGLARLYLPAATPSGTR